MAKRRMLEARLVRRGESGEALRAVRAGDAEGLARLMLDSYRGTIDDVPPGTIEFARAEVARLLSGEWGAFLGDVSLVAEREGELAHATLVALVDGVPFLAFSMTAPEWKRKGLARAGLVRTMNALLDAGHERIRLVVTVGNEGAERLYGEMGFEDEQVSR